MAFKFWGDLVCTSRLLRKAVQARMAGVGGWWKLWFDVFRAGMGREEKAFMGKQRSYRLEWKPLRRGRRRDRRTGVGALLDL